VAPLAGRLVDRYGGGIVAVAGCGAVAATTAPFALVGATADPVLLQLLLAARGMALGLAAIPATVAAYAAVRAEQLPDATTQLNAVQRVGGAVGGALFATILARALPAGPRRRSPRPSGG
jgi:MFS family permease